MFLYNLPLHVVLCLFSADFSLEVLDQVKSFEQVLLEVRLDQKRELLRVFFGFEKCILNIGRQLLVIVFRILKRCRSLALREASRDLVHEFGLRLRCRLLDVLLLEICVLLAHHVTLALRHLVVWVLL